MKYLSPCNKNCNLEPNQEFCLSCFRTIAEIAFWSTYTDVQKKQIMDELANRKIEYRAKNGRV